MMALVIPGACLTQHAEQGEGSGMPSETAARTSSDRGQRGEGWGGGGDGQMMEGGRSYKKKKEEKKNGFNTTLFPGGPPPQY